MSRQKLTAVREEVLRRWHRQNPTAPEMPRSVYEYIMTCSKHELWRQLERYAQPGDAVIPYGMTAQRIKTWMKNHELLSR